MADAACECRQRRATVTLYKVIHGKKSKKCRIKVCSICAEQMVASKKWSY